MAKQYGNIKNKNNEVAIAASNIYIGGGSLNNLINYTTDEIRIGTWIDGKPLYRKIIEFTTITNGLDFNVSIDTLVHSYVQVSENISTNDWRPIPWLFVSGQNYGSTAWAGGYYIRNNGKVLFQIGSSLANIKRGIMIIEYTKTTD